MRSGPIDTVPSPRLCHARTWRVRSSWIPFNMARPMDAHAEISAPLLSTGVPRQELDPIISLPRHGIGSGGFQRGTSGSFLISRCGSISYDRRLLASVLTHCYTSDEMPEDLVIFVKCRNASEKQAFASAAQDRHIPLSRFAIEAMASYARIGLQDRICGHCPTRLAKNNRSGFCRKCLRTIGIAKLQNLHPL